MTKTANPHNSPINNGDIFSFEVKARHKKAEKSIFNVSTEGTKPYIMIGWKKTSLDEAYGGGINTYKLYSKTASRGNTK